MFTDLKVEYQCSQESSLHKSKHNIWFNKQNIYYKVTWNFIKPV